MSPFVVTHQEKQFGFNEKIGLFVEREGIVFRGGVEIPLHREKRCSEHETIYL